MDKYLIILIIVFIICVCIVIGLITYLYITGNTIMDIGINSTGIYTVKSIDGSNSTTQASIQAANQASIQAANQASIQAANQASIQAANQASIQAANQASIKAANQASIQAATQASIQAANQASIQAANLASIQAANQASIQAANQASIQAANQASIQAANQASIQAANQESNQAALQTGPVTNLKVKTHHYSSIGRANNLLMNIATNVADAPINNVTTATNVLNFGVPSLYFDNSNINQGNNQLNTNAQYIKCNPVNSIYYTNGITLSIWINPSILTNWTAALSLGNSQNDYICIGILNNCVYYGMYGGDWTSSGLPINKWTHVAWTISGSGTHVLYINNVAQTPASNGKLLKTNHIYQVCIGANSSVPWFYYNGYVGNTCIYNYVLSASQIESLFNGVNI
jgi:hypothetical protein